jgi:hypothetical protein
MVRFGSTHFELDDLVESGVLTANLESELFLSRNSQEMERFLQLSQDPNYHKLFAEFFKVHGDPEEAKVLSLSFA